MKTRTSEINFRPGLPESEWGQECKNLDLIIQLVPAYEQKDVQDLWVTIFNNEGLNEEKRSEMIHATFLQYLDGQNLKRMPKGFLIGLWKKMRGKNENP